MVFFFQFLKRPTCRYREAISAFHDSLAVQLSDLAAQALVHNVGPIWWASRKSRSMYIDHPDDLIITHAHTRTHTYTHTHAYKHIYIYTHFFPKRSIVAVRSDRSSGSNSLGKSVPRWSLYVVPLSDCHLSMSCASGGWASKTRMPSRVLRMAVASAPHIAGGAPKTALIKSYRGAPGEALASHPLT